MTVSEMATGALNNPYYPYFNAKKMSKIDSIENVDDLVNHALTTQTPNFNHPYKPEEIAIQGFIKHMGPDMTGPNFN